MADIRNLIKKMAAEEAGFAETRFVAPCLSGGQVRARVGGMVQTFTTEPADFTGWGVFQAKRETGRAVAQVVEEADLPLVAEYCKQFPLLRVRLARQLEGLTWLAYPTSEADMAQRFGAVRPIAIHLVTEGGVFEQITARNVGGAYWFEEVDRRADPMPSEQMQEAARNTVELDALQFKGLTPEMRTVYDLAVQTDERFAEIRARREAARVAENLRNAERQYREDQGSYDWYIEAHRDEYDAAWREAENPPVVAPQGQKQRGRGDKRREQNAVRDEDRLRNALELGGGRMHNYTDRGEYYLVEWRTGNGQRHTSAIAKADLTVISSGICLSGRDRHFDLQSLVGVIEKRGH
jgi:hypothetical protein